MNLLEALRMLALEDGSPLEWQKEALCNQTDPEAFFPERWMEGKDAKMVCAKCPVKQDCFDYAVSNNEEYGIWGGVDFSKRKYTKRIKQGDNNDSGHEGKRTRTVSVRTSEFQRLTEEGGSIRLQRPMRIPPSK